MDRPSAGFFVPESNSEVAMRKWFSRFKAWILGTAAIIVALFGLTLFSEDNNLSWEHDGIDVAGFNIYHSLNGSIFSAIDTVDAAARAYLHGSQTDGEHCYYVTAFDADNNESVPSNTACKVIDTLAPNPPSNLTVN